MKRLIFAIYLLLCLSFVHRANAEPVSYDAIHNAIVRLPVAYTDRNDSYKPQQLETIARSIERATQQARWPDNNRIALAAMLISIGYHESRFAIRIHNWNPKRYSYSYGIWQVTPQAHGVDRTELIGLLQDQTDSAALIAARVLSKSRQCGDTPEGWFTAYYGGVSCGTKWRTLTARANTFWWVRKMLFDYDRIHA